MCSLRLQTAADGLCLELPPWKTWPVEKNFVSAGPPLTYSMFRLMSPDLHLRHRNAPTQHGKPSEAIVQSTSASQPKAKNILRRPRGKGKSSRLMELVVPDTCLRREIKSWRRFPPKLLCLRMLWWEVPQEVSECNRGP